LGAQIDEAPSNQLGIIVVIPVHNEKDLLISLKSLANCDRPGCFCEVLLVFNASEDSDEEIISRNKAEKKKVQSWYDSQKDLCFKLFTIEQNNLPNKHAGVGLARKIGMDEATRRFNSIENMDGIILCFDADSECEPNYLVEIEKQFLKKPKLNAASIYFEHALKGDKFEESVYEAILYYELHLRYYKNALRYANLPYAYHTIGSSMAVRAKDYVLQGGMNKRKAGEDFYFLQRFTNNPHFHEINSTTVFPSPRPSDRVPFGTGRAIKEILLGQRDEKSSYAFESFTVLKEIFHEVDNWEETYPFSPYLKAFLGEKELRESINKIRSNTKNAEDFKKAIFTWFNAFKALKFVHFLRDNYFPNEPLAFSVPKLLKEINSNFKTGSEANNLLLALREIDKL